MVRTPARVVLALLGVGLLALSLIGVTVASENLATLAVMAAFGAGAGLFVGASASWSGDRDVRASDAVRFAGGGLAIVFGLTGAGAVDGVLPPLAVLAMLVGGWLLYEYLRDGATTVTRSSRVSPSTARAAPPPPLMAAEDHLLNFRDADVRALIDDIAMITGSTGVFMRRIPWG